MPDKAHIRSVDAVETFRVRLIQYFERATTILDEVSSEVRGTLMWLEDKQKPYWEQQVRLRLRALEEAQHEIFGARLSQFRESSDAQQMAVHRAKRALREAEEKLRRVKTWRRRYQSDVEPLGREVEKLRTILIQDLKKGALYLERLLRTLDGYTERRQALESTRAAMEDELRSEKGKSELESNKAAAEQREAAS